LDYVVAGFGIGAVLALVGFALWELFGTSDETGGGWLVRAAIGSMLGALVIWAITGVSLVSSVDDSTGSHLVLLTTVVTLLAIVVVSFWYRRIEQPLPRETRSSRAIPAQPAEREQMAPLAAGIELTEWDTWPEREQDQEAVPEPVRFEPETAAEPATLPAPDADEAQDIVVAVEALSIRSIPVGDDDESAAREHVLADPGDDNESSESQSPETEPSAERTVARPGNVRAFRPRPVPRVEIEHLHPVAEDLPVESVDVEEPFEAEPSADLDAGPSEPVEHDSEPDEPVPSAEAVPAAGFESSLLADIDASTVSGDGRYRSPLLADLEPGADELQEIGLAKWRPEDRLTSDEPEEPPRRRGK